MIAYGLTYVFVILKKFAAKNNYVEQTYLKKHLNYTILLNYCVMAISKNSNRSLKGIKRSLSQRGIIKYMKIFQFK